MLRWLPGFWGLALLSVGCDPLVMRADFKPVGLVQTNKPQPSVASRDKVLVFNESAPPGFSLRENELKVEPGFAHRIIGVIEVSRDWGKCSQVDHEASPYYAIQELAQDEAYKQGANALIYYVSELSPAASPSQLTELCSVKARATTRRWFGHGWAVLLEPSKAGSTEIAPAAATGLPSAPPSPAARAMGAPSATQPP